MTSLRSALFAGHVVHQRTRPKRHRLRYSVFYLALDLEEAPIVGRTLRAVLGQPLQRFQLP